MAPKPTSIAPPAAPVVVVPLRHRLPNPPPLFVGREDASAHLATMIQRAPLTVVWGPGGLGKTALVLAVLHRRFAAQAQRTVVVALRPGDPPEQVRVDIVRALTALTPGATLDWRAPRAEPELLAAVAIDLAEAAGAWVVLDDAHHGDADVVGELFQSVARYARASRWIATSRLRPRLPALAEQQLLLPAMADTELAALAEASAFGHDRAWIRRAVAVAAGSPWRMRQYLATGELPEEHTGADLLQGLSDAAVEFLAALTVLEVPLPLDKVARFVPPPPAAELEGLEARGLFERSPGGVRLHDVARSLLQSTAWRAATGPWPARAAAALGRTDDVGAQCEAVRLHCLVEQYDDAARVLAACGEALLAAGQVARLWRWLEPVTDPRLARWRLRCAVEIADARCLAAVREPPADALDERLLWCRLLHYVGHADTAAAAGALRAAATAAGDESTAFEAGILEARSVFAMGRTAPALAVLQRLTPRRPDQAVRHAGHLLRYLARAGDAHRALALALDMVRPPPELSASARAEVGVQLVMALTELGRRRTASEAYAAWVGGDGPEPALWRSRQVLLLGLYLALLAGELRATSELYRRYQPVFASNPTMDLSARALESERRLHAGELAGLEEVQAGLRREQFAMPHAARSFTTLYHSAALAALRGRASPEAVAWPAEAPAPDPLVARFLAVYALELQLHAGGDVPAAARSAGADVAPHDSLSVVSMSHRIAALAALRAGDAGAAVAAAHVAAECAREHGWSIFEAEARQVLCEALVVAARFDELRAAADALAALAAGFPSPRYVGEARFFQALAAARGLDPVALEDLAVLADVAPVAARRAQALLGGAPVLDAVDACVLAAVARLASGTRVETVGVPGATSPWRKGWGLDETRQALWLPDGRVVELSTRMLFWRILSTLADRGGAATKEQLATDAWDAKGYHPLRDDKRMHVAVRKLRLLLEADPSAPTRLVTTEEGYALGDDEAVRRLRAPSPEGLRKS